MPAHSFQDPTDSEQFYSCLGVLVQNRRSELGLSLANLAELSGFNISKLKHVEAGTTKIRVHEMLHLCNVLDEPLTSTLLPELDLK